MRYHVRAVVFDGPKHLVEYTGRVRLATSRISLLTKGEVGLNYKGKDQREKIRMAG